MTSEVMFDTNVFGNITDGESPITPDMLEDAEARFVVTHIQQDELEDTSDEEQRKRLLDVFSQTADMEQATKMTVAGISKIGKSKIGNGELYNRIRSRLDGEKEENDWKDAVIAATAIESDMIFVTEDGPLQNALDDLGHDYMTEEEFVRWLEDG